MCIRDSTIIDLLAEKYGDAIEKPVAREWWDVKIYGYPVNIKSSAFKNAADNFSSKAAILYALTDLPENKVKVQSWQTFENLKLPKDKIIAPGVIDSTTNFVEHPEVVKNRILTYAKVIDIEQLLAGTDCGFSTFAGFGNVDESIVYKKLEALVRGSELASKVI